MDVQKILGLTVTDRRGRSLGIITQPTPEHDGEVFVRVWEPYFCKYLIFSKHYKTLVQVSADNWFNVEDPVFLEMVRDSCSDLALATHDEEWFNRLHGIKKRKQKWA